MNSVGCYCTVFLFVLGAAWSQVTLDFYTNAAGQPKAPFHQNQYGAKGGGPIVRSKTFFADYQGTRQSATAGSSIPDVPPADSVRLEVCFLI